jgi:hypothetical protein
MHLRVEDVPGTHWPECTCMLQQALTATLVTDINVFLSLMFSTEQAPGLVNWSIHWMFGTTTANLQRRKTFRSRRRMSRAHAIAARKHAEHAVYTAALMSARLITAEFVQSLAGSSDCEASALHPSAQNEHIYACHVMQQSLLQYICLGNQYGFESMMTSI